MFARKVAARLKPNSLTEFTNLMEREILPWLREQEGFLGLMTLAGTDGSEVATISFWDHKGNVQAYNSGGYPEALKILGELLDGTPYVKTFEVVSSMLQGVIPALPFLTGSQVQESDSMQQGDGSYKTSIGEEISRSGSQPHIGA
jgi:heme-degrading monooxygenase HmoA